MNFSVTKHGVPVDPKLYNWDLEKRFFKSHLSDLVLDFSCWDDCHFDTGWNCTFRTGRNCNFLTDSECNFRTGPSCTFGTGSNCSFDTMDGCNFATLRNCTFRTGVNCIFEAGNNSLAVIRHGFHVIDLSDYKKVEFMHSNKIYFDGEIMTYEEYKYLELVKNI
jgi:hypothetical protein